MKLVMTIAGIIAIVLLAFGSAFAQVWDQVPLTVSITGGNFTIDLAGSGVDFGTVTLNGTNITRSRTLPRIRVNDSRGTAAGWHVTLRATDLQGVAPATGMIPAPTLTCTNSDIYVVGGSSPEDPLNYPFVLCNDQEITTEFTLFSANNGYGAGFYEYRTNIATSYLKLTIPMTTLVGNYSGNLTATLYQTP